MANQITTKDELLSKLLFEIVQSASSFTHGGDEDPKQMYVSSESSLYPPYVIDVRSKPCNWMIGDDKENSIVVNVLFLKTSESIKGRYVFVNSDELTVKNEELQDAMSILINDVFDDTSSYDVTFYPPESEARNALIKLIRGSEEDCENDDVEGNCSFINKEEITSLVDDLFEADE